MPRISNKLRERVVGMLDAGMSKDFERQEAPMTCHVVDFRILQHMVKIAIS